MKRFLFKLAVFVVIQGLVFMLLMVRYDTSSEANYLAQTVDKHQRLWRIPSPKLVVVGGSNVPFGIQCEKIQAALGIPTVNMGLAAGEGIDFMLAEIKPALRKGDVVLLSLEYDRFGGGFDPNILQQILQYRPASVVHLRAKHIRKVVLDRGLQILGGIVRHALTSHLRTDTNRPRGVQSRGFNAWGDLVRHYGQPNRLPPTQANSGKLFPDSARYPTSDVVRQLREFATFCHQREVRFTFSFPPHPPRPIEESAVIIQEIASALSGIPHLTVLDSPTDHAYDPALFYDTGYHLNQAGAKLRTEKLIVSLRTLQTESPGGPSR
jgi:hypothetical protein